MQAWFVRGEPDSEAERLGTLLRQWAERAENGQWSVEGVPGTPEALSALQAHPPEVLFAADSSCPSGSRITELLGCGVGLVVAASSERAESYRALVEQHAVQVMPWPADVESVGLAVFNVLAQRKRQGGWQARIDHLQQRLNDRIIIERAKGILVQRLGISEKEAYKRLRVLSRRQRRQIRDIAQSLLDTQSLLLPEESNGFAEAHQHLADSPAGCSDSAE